MFQKVSIIASLKNEFASFKNLSIEVTLVGEQNRLSFNSGFMQVVSDKENVVKSMDTSMLTRVKMLPSIWWKGKNDDQVCLFEFLDKDYKEIEIKVSITKDNKINSKTFRQPLTAGVFEKDEIMYSVKFADM